MADLDTAKRRLSETLRDRMPKYWELMKDWCRRRISKDDFDSNAKLLLGENNIHLHNEFLFAILVKCQTGSIPLPPPAPSPISPVPMLPIDSPDAIPQVPPMLNSYPSSTATNTAASTPSSTTTAAFIKPPKAKKPKPTPPAELPYGVLDMMRYHEAPRVQLLPRDLDTILLCTHELMLPDLPTMHTRMLLVAWELQLEEVTEEAAKLLMLALQCHLKNVLQALISSQTSWSVKPHSHFQHSFGHAPSLNSPTPPLPRAPHVGVEERVELGGVKEATSIRTAALSGPVRTLEPLSLFHLRDALRVNRQCVPVHSVYSLNMERILAGMWHPSQEEEEQKKVVEQWKRSMEKDTPFAIPAAANYGRR